MFTTTAQPVPQPVVVPGGTITGQDPHPQPGMEGTRPFFLFFRDCLFYITSLKFVLLFLSDQVAPEANFFDV